MSEFELSPELVDQVIFSMENQNVDFCLDPSTRQILESKDRQEGVHYYDIPFWSSVEGFQMMEKFSDTLRNPLIREDLRLVMNSGRGVFRKFKNVLREHPDVEKKWFLFKKKYMKDKVYEWYNQLRDLWGLSHIDAVPEDLNDLLDEDFVFSIKKMKDFPQWEEWGPLSLEEAFKKLPSGGDLRYADYWLNKLGPETMVLAAETPNGELAGFLLFREYQGFHGLMAEASVIYVLTEFRGMGIARKLVQRMIRNCREGSFRDVYFRFAGDQDLLKNVLIQEEGTPLGGGYHIDLGLTKD